MAGLIAALFGGRSRPPDPDPLPGQGGYDMPAGPAGQSGFSGSTSATRTFRGASPRAAKLRADTNVGWESGLSSTPQVRQASYRGDVRGARTSSPRRTPPVVTPQPVIAEQMQATPGTNLGGPMLKTGLGNCTAGAHPLSGSAAYGGHSMIDTTTPYSRAQTQIGVGTPGAENVRNQVAERYKNPPGEVHAYRSAPRGDQPGVTEVVVPNRFVFEGGGNQTWSVIREMPYNQGDGHRGASLNGDRYYAVGGYDNFANAGRGSYGIARARGPLHRPTVFQEPAPWSTNFYDTTQSVGTVDNPGPGGQAPNMAYVSPSVPRRNTATRGT